MNIMQKAKLHEVSTKSPTPTPLMLIAKDTAVAHCQQHIHWVSAAQISQVDVPNMMSSVTRTASVTPGGEVGGKASLERHPSNAIGVQYL